MSEQRWNFKRLLAEFLVIFAGVTLSLLADDWRDTRNDARDEVAALELIHADLVRDTAEFAFSLRPVRGHEEATIWLMQRWDDPSAPTDSLASALGRYFIFNSFDLQDAAYSSLKEATRLSLITNDSLRAAIVDYFDKRQVNAEAFLMELFEMRGRTLDLLSHHARWPPLRDPDRAWPWIGSLRLVSTRAELASDIRLANQIQMMGALATLSLSVAERALDANDALRQQIVRELAGR